MADFLDTIEQRDAFASELLENNRPLHRSLFSDLSSMASSAEIFLLFFNAFKECFLRKLSKKFQSNYQFDI